MCYYDRLRYICSHIDWSDVKSLCKAAAESEEKCEVKTVRKHVYPHHGRPCSKCGVEDPTLFDFEALLCIRPPQSLPRQLCEVAECFLPAGHILAHMYWTPCQANGCYLPAHHPPPHSQELLVTSRTTAIQFAEVRKRSEQMFQQLNLLVLNAMGTPLPRVLPRVLPPAEVLSTSPQNDLKVPVTHLTVKERVENFNAKRLKQRTTTSRPAVPLSSPQPYLDLNLSGREIRLFELCPELEGRGVQGTFRYVKLSNFRAYTALSYTWGSPTDVRKIMVHGSGPLEVRRNLWDFLRQQRSVITERKLFWIDALCINQSNVRERNHQVNLMKEIYMGASEVCIWLGTASSNSEIAMDYITKKQGRKLRPRGPGFDRIWTREQGRAIRDLCERSYWRRMWVIQEIVHAERITVWCGPKSFTWDVVESLYLILKTLQDTHWFPHHDFAIEVLQSSAAVMIWQRAHWRHPDTRKPSLGTLIEVFRHWQCADIRDKVFALVSMANPETAIAPNYSLSASEVYFSVCNSHPREGWRFENLLSQVLGLSGRIVNLSNQDL